MAVIKIVKSKPLKVLIAEKVVKASNTNGIKQQILGIIGDECLKRSFNKYEAINAINAIPRTRFFIKTSCSSKLKTEHKYRVVRFINSNNNVQVYKLEYLQGNLVLHAY